MHGHVLHTFLDMVRESFKVSELTTEMDGVGNAATIGLLPLSTQRKLQRYVEVSTAGKGGGGGGGKGGKRKGANRPKSEKCKGGAGKGSKGKGKGSARPKGKGKTAVKTERVVNDGRRAQDATYQYRQEVRGRAKRAPP